MKKPVVIVGYSTCWKTREALRAAGAIAFTCDLLPAREDDPRPRHHIQGDIHDVLLSRHFDFGIMHPMCTYLTVSAAWAFKDPDFDRYPGVGYHQKVKPGTLTGAARRAQRRKEIANFRDLMALPFPCVIENPAMNFVSKFVGGPTQIIHPHMFGDDASKATGLWHNTAALAAGVPKLVPTRHVQPRYVGGLPRWSNQTDSGQNNMTPSDNRWLDRSATFPGIAAALGTQYGSWAVRA